MATIGLPNLLSEIVSQALDAQKNMMLVTSFESLSQAERELARVDVFITSMEDSESHKLNEFLFKHPKTAVINLSDSARTGEMIKLEISRVELDDLSPKRIIQAINEGVSNQ